MVSDSPGEISCHVSWTSSPPIHAIDAARKDFVKADFERLSVRLEFQHVVIVDGIVVNQDVFDIDQRLVAVQEDNPFEQLYKVVDPPLREVLAFHVAEFN